MPLPTGTRVRLLPPFAMSFPGEYLTVPAPPPEEGAQPDTENNYLDGVPGGVADEHLEVI